MPVKILAALAKRSVPLPVLVTPLLGPMTEATMRVAAPSWVKISSAIPEVRRPPVIVCVPALTADVISTPPLTIFKVAPLAIVTVLLEAEAKVSVLTEVKAATLPVKAPPTLSTLSTLVQVLTFVLVVEATLIRLFVAFLPAK